MEYGKNATKGADPAKVDAKVDLKADLAAGKFEPKTGPKMVKMKRKHPQHPGGPLTATVHPTEVRNFSEAGWYEEE